MGWVKNNQSGLTMVELVVAATVMAIIVVSLLELLVTDISTVALGKARSLGLSIATEKMEYLRNLPYDSLATQYGPILPQGTIPDDQTITRNNLKFRVHTAISFVDDPYDGNAAGTIPGKPVDLYPYDYKKAEVTVYLANSNTQVATLTTNISAKAAETATNTGILSISVQDANGQPVKGASVHITNSVVSPAVDITTTTDNAGSVVVPKLLPDSSHNYQVTASLAGYSTDQTYADPPGSQTAVNPNPNVLVQQITNVTLSIDRLATLSMHIQDTSGVAIASQQVTVTGSRKKYTNPTVYTYSSVQTTDASGNFTISNLGWDSYSFSVAAGMYIVTTSPMQPTPVNPNVTTSVTMVLSTLSTWPTITAISPLSDVTGTTSSTMTITGTNFATGTTVKLSRAGQPDIVATSATLTGTTKITATFNLTGAATGSWDVVVSSGGNTATQPGVFNVTP